MEFETPQPQENETPAVTCAQCGNARIDLNSPTPLCTDCRNAFIKYPIPVWIKGVGIAILALLIFALSGLPKNISLAIHLQRGKKAEQQKKFVTAQREFAHVLKAVPNHLETKAHLCLASYHNMDYSTFAKLANELQGKIIDDKELVAAVEHTFETGSNYFLNDSLAALIQQYPDSAGGIPDQAYLQYFKKHEEDVFAKYQYASVLYERKDYKACDSIATSITSIQKDFVPAIMLLTSLKRIEEDVKSSLFYCDELIAMNKESVYGISSKARTLLKMKKDKEALNLALQSKAIDSEDGYNLATLALAYHFNQQPQKRDEIIQQVKSTNDSSRIYYLQGALDIISNKEKFRN